MELYDAIDGEETVQEHPVDEVKHAKMNGEGDGKQGAERRRQARSQH